MSTAVFSSRNTATIFETFYIGIYFYFPVQCCIFFLCLGLNEFIAYLFFMKIILLSSLCILLER